VVLIFSFVFIFILGLIFILSFIFGRIFWVRGGEESGWRGLYELVVFVGRGIAAPYKVREDRECVKTQVG
jgi:hypothetical protein